MATHYPKRALEILREEGPVEFLSKSKSHLSYKITKYIYKKPEKSGFVSAERWTEIQTRKNIIINNAQYDALADPYRILTIDSSNIKYKQKGVYSPWHAGFLQIKGGEWDKNRYDFDNHWTKIGFRERFKQGKEWEETKYYEKLIKRYSDISSPFGFENAENFVSCRCEYYDELYSGIMENGYKGAGDDVDHWRNSTNDERLREHFSHQLESLVAIGRAGQFSSVDGKHRLAIAQLQDLKIPVQVVCRHKQWQELRDEIHNNGLPKEHEDLRDHPDLQDILN